jgi:hypothetical protein
MVHSSILAVTTDSKHLTYGVFSLSETVRFESLEFIADCFDNMSLSTKGSESSAVFIGTTSSGSPPLCTILKGSTNEFYTASSGEGSSGLPISRRRSMGTPPAPIATAPWSKDAPTPQTMMTVPPQTIMQWSNTGQRPERWHTFLEGQRAHAHA